MLVSLVLPLPGLWKRFTKLLIPPRPETKSTNPMSRVKGNSTHLYQSFFSAAELHTESCWQRQILQVVFSCMLACSWGARSHRALATLSKRVSSWLLEVTAHCLRLCRILEPALCEPADRCVGKGPQWELHVVTQRGTLPLR